MDALLDLMDHNVEVDELQVESKGKQLDPLPHDRNLQGLQRALASHHADLLIEGAHSNNIAI